LSLGLDPLKPLRLALFLARFAESLFQEGGRLFAMGKVWVEMGMVSNGASNTQAFNSPIKYRE